MLKMSSRTLRLARMKSKVCNNFNIMIVCLFVSIQYSFKGIKGEKMNMIFAYSMERYKKGNFIVIVCLLLCKDITKIKSIM